MPKPNVNIKFNAKAFEKDIKKWGQKRDQEIKVQLETSARNIESQAKSLVPVGVSGALRASINVKTLDNGYRKWIGSGVRDGKPVKYAKDIEFGRKPGTMPSYEQNSPLFKWVKFKLGIAGKMTQKVTYLIARKIFQEGFEKEPFLIPAFKKEIPAFDKAIKRIMKKTTK